VSIEHKTYRNDRGGKGSVAGSQEVLFVCTPKKKQIISSICKKGIEYERF
jgi:hypothetical protein